MQNVFGFKIQRQIVEDVHQLYFDNQLALAAQKVFGKIHKLAGEDRRQIQVHADIFRPVCQFGRRHCRQNFSIQSLAQIHKQPAVGDQIKIRVEIQTQILNRHKKFLKQNLKLSGAQNPQHALPLDNFRNVRLVERFNNLIDFAGFNRPFVGDLLNFLFRTFNSLFNIFVESAELFGKAYDPGKFGTVPGMKRRIGRKPLPQLFHRIFHHVGRNVSGQNHEIAVGKNKKLAARRTDHTVKQFGENLNELGMTVFRLKL